MVKLRPRNRLSDSFMPMIREMTERSPHAEHQSQQRHQQDRRPAGDRRAPSLRTTLVRALTFALSLGSFVLALVGPPTWALRAAAVGFVISIFVGVVVWYSGLEEGRRWNSDDR